MNYKRISETHPYFTACDDGVTEFPPKPPASDLDRIYHPENALWPLYALTVRRLNNGVTISYGMKLSSNEWWRDAGVLPFPLISVLVEMLEAAK